jgi:Tol biopolymer transport system component
MAHSASIARISAVLLLALGVASCGGGADHALTAQQSAGGGDPEVVARRVLDLLAISGRLDPVTAQPVNGMVEFSDPVPFPDGRSVVLTGWPLDQQVGNLYVRDLATGAERQITHDSVGYPMHWASRVSADGRWIAFIKYLAEPTHGYELRIMRSDGTGERALVTICCREDIPRTIDWADGYAFSPDGQSLLASVWMRDGTNRFEIFSVQDGSSSILKSFDWRSPGGASFSPDGRYIVYDVPSQSGQLPRVLYLIAADGTREQRLTDDPAVKSVIGWAADGSAVYYQTTSETGTSSVWRLPIRDARVSGVATLVRDDLLHTSSWKAGTNGLSYEVKTPRSSIWTASIDIQSGRVLAPPTVVVSDPGMAEGRPLVASWSPDGQSLAYFRQRHPGLPLELVVHSPSSGEQTAIELPLDEADRQWRWDDRSIVVRGTLRTRRQYLRVDIPSARVSVIEDPALIERMDGIEGPQASFLGARMSPDIPVKYIIRTNGTSPQLLAQDVGSSAERILYTAPANHELRGPYLSPDGSHLAFVIGAPGKEELRALSTAGGDSWLVKGVDTTIGPESVIWTSDGRALLLNQQAPQRLWRVNLDGSDAKIILSRQVARPRLSPDDRRIVFQAPAEGTPVSELWVLENLPESRTRASTPR